MDKNSTTKAIALVEKVDYMLQIQIVVKTVGKQIDIEYPVSINKIYHNNSSFHSLDIHFCQCQHIYNAARQQHETSYLIITSKLRSCI